MPAGCDGAAAVSAVPGRVPDRIAALESLRGLLAVWVVLGHLLTVSGLDAGSWTGPGKLLARGIHAVDVFIILSGFVIWMLLHRGGETAPAFITRRFFRLFPVYLLCLAAAILTLPLAVTALHALPWDNAHNTERLNIFADSMAFFPAQLGAHLLMIHGLLPDAILPSSPYAFAGQAWSISLEWQFYLIAPLLFYWCRRGWRALAVLTMTALTLHFLTASWPSSSLPPQFILFVIGMLSYEGWRQRERIPAKAVPWLLPAGLAAAAAAAAAGGRPGVLIWALVYLTMLATQCGARGTIERTVMRVLDAPRLRALGDISYSLYLNHMVVLYLVLYALAPYAQGLGRYGHFALLAVCVCSLSFALSCGLYRWVERPGIRAGKRLAIRLMGRHPPRAAVSAGIDHQGAST